MRENLVLALYQLFLFRLAKDAPHASTRSGRKMQRRALLLPVNQRRGSLFKWSQAAVQTSTATPSLRPTVAASRGQEITGENSQTNNQYSHFAAGIAASGRSGKRSRTKDSGVRDEAFLINFTPAQKDLGLTVNRNEISSLSLSSNST